MNRIAVKSFIFFLAVGVVIALSVISYSLVSLAAWQDPVADPPAGNVPAPILLGPDAQTKLGSLNVTGGYCLSGNCISAWSDTRQSKWVTSGSNISYTTGNIGIGTSNPASPLAVGGEINIIAGQLLYPDATPQTAAWNTSSTIFASQVTNGTFGAGAYVFPSNLGVATTSPVGLPQILSVYGGGYISGSLGIGTSTPASRLTVVGTLESTMGGLKFPDGTTQITRSGTPNQWVTASPNIYFTGGNVGISDQNPTSTLSVGGEVKTTTGGLRLPDATLQSAAWNSASQMSASQVTTGVFPAGNFSFPSSTGIATSTNTALPHSLSVYGNGYISGSLGVGTSSPAQKLSVTGVIESTTGGFKFPDGTVQTTAAGTPTQWTTAGSNIYFTGGNVGVNDTNPTSTLSVGGELKTTTGGLRLPDNTLETTAWNSASQMSASQVTTGVFAAGNFSFPSSLGINTSTQVGLPQLFSVYGNGYIAGNLGINVSPPQEALHVATSSANGTRILVDNRTISASKNASLAFAKNGTVNWVMGSDLVSSNGTDVFSVYGGVTPSHKFVIDTNGNIGINQLTPGSTLDVKGTLRLSGSSSGFVGLTAQANAGSVTYTWPQGDGQNGQALYTFGSGGNLFWAWPGYWGAQGTTTNIFYIDGNVGIGTNAPQERLHVAQGDVLIDAKAVNDGTTIQQIFNDGGSGGSSNLSSLVAYNGYLYAGHWNGISRYDGTSWTAVGGSSGFQSPVMIVYNGSLYATSAADGNVYRYDGGSTWTDVMTTPVALPTNGYSIPMGVYNGQLYVGTSAPSPYGTIYRYDGNGAWTSIGSLNTMTTLPMDCSGGRNCGVTSFVVYNAALYVGFGNGFLFRYDGGSSWTLAHYHNDGTSVVYQMAVYNGSLYALAAFTELHWDGASYGHLWRYDGGTTWTDVQGSFMIQNSDWPLRFATYNGRLYAFTQRGIENYLYRYDGGTSWTRINFVNESAGAAAIYKDSLCFGGGSIWCYAANTAQSYALKFKSENEIASVRFRTGSSGQGNNGTNQHGQFIFSHGLLTNTGAYDIAESYRTEEPSLGAGELVSTAVYAPDSVRRSKGAYDKALIGVVSTDPAYILTGDGMDSESAVQVAIKGRAPVKVSTENGSIKVGDPITASSRPGIGMKATKSGKIIGYAIEPFPKESRKLLETKVGTIDVSIALGWYSPVQEASLQTGHSPVQDASLQTGRSPIQDASLSTGYNGSVALNNEPTRP